MELSLVMKYLRYAGLQQPARISTITSAWHGHIAFARVLVAETSPHTFVELGTHLGDSFFAFCQAVVEHALPTQCYAIDIWTGDEQAGSYDETVFMEVQAHVAGHYASCAHLIRSEFDAALGQFANESIDILHIDGLHTYEATRHDFETWLPKVRRGGIILLHDVNEYQKTFGAHKVWDEIAPLTPERHLFRHSHGLGVWRKPGGAALDSPLLACLLGRDETSATIIDRYMTSIAEREINRLQAERLEGELQRRTVERDASLQEQERLRVALACIMLEKECIMEEKERITAQYASVRQSRSWRITRPLRALALFFRALAGDTA